MRTDTRLARMLHVLVHIHLLGGRETSETIALMLNTNPVVVRRTMASLREHGMVQSKGGRRGGWILVKAPDKVTVRDVHCALSDVSVFAVGLSSDHSECPVEIAVNAVLDEALQRAQDKLLDDLGNITLADLAARFKAK